MLSARGCVIWNVRWRWRSPYWAEKAAKIGNHEQVPRTGKEGLYIWYENFKIWVIIIIFLFYQFWMIFNMSLQLNWMCTTAFSFFINIFTTGLCWLPALYVDSPPRLLFTSKNLKVENTFQQHFYLSSVNDTNAPQFFVLLSKIMKSSSFEIFFLVTTGL